MKHSKDLVIFPDRKTSHARGPFSGHFITHRRFKNDGKPDIDGEAWYVGTIVRRA